MNNRLARLSVPVGIVGIVMLLVVPVPALLLDFLIVCNILLALLVLLTSMFVKKPLDFSVFPSLLLVATLFRLGLNVASTRLVLGEGYAGQVIEAFGHVTVGGSMIIGAVVFLILVVIQFVVVTKGAERVAEVGARFTLDAMPGKQMAIDADLNAGLITDTQARERRAEVSAEADFYGAMDGASKFVKGDAIAGIIIIIINFVGGIAIGMLQRGMEIGDALSTYGMLTMGDGLVTQIPALLMAVSTGMIVTRSNAESDMGSTASAQLMQSPTALMIAGVAAIAMALIPGMPPLPFILVGGGLTGRVPPGRRQATAGREVGRSRGDGAEFPSLRSDTSRSSCALSVSASRGSNRSPRSPSSSASSYSGSREATGTAPPAIARRTYCGAGAVPVEAATAICARARCCASEPSAGPASVTRSRSARGSVTEPRSFGSRDQIVACQGKVGRKPAERAQEDAQRGPLLLGREEDVDDLAVALRGAARRGRHPGGITS